MPKMVAALAVLLVGGLALSSFLDAPAAAQLEDTPMILDGTSATSAAATGQAAADKRKLDGDLNQFLTLLV